jgi:hypothetical protein
MARVGNVMVIHLCGCTPATWGQPARGGVPRERRVRKAATADELGAFVAQVRAECDDALARLDTVDPAMLPPDVCDLYDQQRARWRELRALTEDNAVELPALGAARTAA